MAAMRLRTWLYGLRLLSAKEFCRDEGKKFQIRTDFFNVFNHPNFSLPVSNLAHRLPEKITSMNGIPADATWIAFDF